MIQLNYYSRIIVIHYHIKTNYNFQTQLEGIIAPKK